MEIKKISQGCFKIKGKKAIILVQPKKELKNIKAHILISASEEETPKVRGEPLKIFGPGEYEAKGTRILGRRREGTKFYEIKTDGLSLLYFSEIDKNYFQEKHYFLSQADVLFLPVKNFKLASLIINDIEPLVVIPTKEEGLEEFLKERKEEVERLDKLVITKEELPEERKIVVLSQIKNCHGPGKNSTSQ